VLSSHLVRQRKIADLRAKNYHGSADEWQSILRHAFNPQSATPLPDDQLKGLEVVAAVASGKVTINLRNRIDKITQRLGSVELSQDDDVEIQLFDWCGSAVDQKSALEAEKSDLRSKYDSAQATVASLQAKLEELIKAKADYEEELISKFVLLLNEKKLKIRNQQRLLSTAKVDQKKLQQMQKTLDGKGRRAGSSGAGKRRADAGAEEDEAQSDSSDAFEKIDVDKQDGIVARSQQASPERQTTPETETATESEDAAPEPAPNASLAPRPSTSNRTRAPKKTTSPPPKPSKTQQPQNKSTSPPPPVRQLPFAKKGSKATKVSEPEPQPEQEQQPEKPQRAAGIQNNTKAEAGDSGEETETDDDEL
jgi:DNA double-strand break repair and V(D)J recombination protein XRCC4